MTLSFREPRRTMKISSETEIGLGDKSVWATDAWNDAEMTLKWRYGKEMFIPESTRAAKMREMLKSIDTTAYFKALWSQA